MKFSSTLLLAIFFGITCTSFAQSIPQEKIDSIVAATMRENKMVGVSLGIVRQGKIIYTQGYGTRILWKSEPIDSTTNFLTCSISKLFTATAIMQLVEEGKIDVKKPLTYYLPEFTMKDKRYKEITIEQLLTHTSGMPNIRSRHFIHPPNDSLALTCFAQALRRKKLPYPPGVQLSAKTYSNTGYDILGRVIEVVTHQTYSRYVSEHVLKPVGMSMSSFFIDSIPQQRRSTPTLMSWLTHGIRATSYYPDIPQDKPCGNLNSCSLDLCKWMLHNLSIYHRNSTGVVSAATLTDMWTTKRDIPGYTTSIGWGWWIVQSKKYGKYVFHVGNDPGYSATLMLSPENDFGIVLLCNGEYPRQIVWNQLPFQIMDLFSEEWKR